MWTCLKALSYSGMPINIFQIETGPCQIILSEDTLFYLKKASEHLLVPSQYRKHQNSISNLLKVDKKRYQSDVKVAALLSVASIRSKIFLHDFHNGEGLKHLNYVIDTKRYKTFQILARQLLARKVVSMKALYEEGSSKIYISYTYI